MDKEYDSVTISIRDGRLVLEYKAEEKITYTHTVPEVDFEGGCTLTLDWGRGETSNDR